jgi:3-phosphoshikimate 1-carboxyvinyltransferase
MDSFRVKPASALRNQISLPADKSITHRAIILSAIIKGKNVIENFSPNQDCLQTIQALKKLGVKIIRQRARLIIHGNGLRGLRQPAGKIFVGNSGTTLRLLLGILAGQPFSATLSAGNSLSRRPMRRVTEPLRRMGAVINAKCKKQNATIEEYSPITIRGGRLKAIKYQLPVASAQVKSAILLAGMYARGITEVVEPLKTRDHTERMLKFFGADLKVKGSRICIKGSRALERSVYLNIPGDISSASFFLVAATLVDNSQLTLRSVGLNPSRIGILKILKRMGARINIRPAKSRINNYEPVGDIIVRTSQLKGTRVKKREIPSLIDELPVLMVAACLAEGKTTIEAVKELRVKETDRITSMIMGLSKMGAKIRVRPQGNDENIIITGVKQLNAARVRSFGDHRTAMSLIIAGLKAKGNTVVDGVRCINKSFPTFLKILKRLIN